jgi:hypothetical protein
LNRFQNTQRIISIAAAAAAAAESVVEGQVVAITSWENVSRERQAANNVSP